jgi:hypothetical protein
VHDFYEPNLPKPLTCATDVDGAPHNHIGPRKETPSEEPNKERSKRDKDRDADREITDTKKNL